MKGTIGFGVSMALPFQVVRGLDLAAGGTWLDVTLWRHVAWSTTAFDSWGGFDGRSCGDWIEDGAESSWWDENEL